MAYYQGDYVRGGYYRGDPFFGFLGKLVKGAVGGLLGGGSKTIIQQVPQLPGVVSKAGTVVRGVGKIGQRIKPILRKGAPIAAAAGAGALIGRGTRGMMGGGRRHRRMNVTNVKALRRSIRRTQGFAKLAMRVIHITHPKKKGRFGGFRKARRKKVC